MKSSIASALLVTGLVVGSGCGGPQAPAAEPASAGPAAPAEPASSGPALVVRNSSSQTICYVSFSPASDGSWGPDRLGASEVIAPGATRGWRVPASSYDIRLQDCDHNVILDRRGVAVAGEGVLLTYQ